MLFGQDGKVMDLQGNPILVLKGHIYPVLSGAFSPDGSAILTGSSDRTARLWDLEGHCIQVFTGHKYDVYSVAFSPDGKTILTGSADSTAILWDLRGNILQKYTGIRVIFARSFLHLMAGPY